MNEEKEKPTSEVTEGQPQETQETEELTSDSNENLVDEVMNDDEENELDLSDFSLEQLIDEAKKAMELIPNKANAKLRQLRPIFFDKFQSEKKEALEKHNEESGDEETEFTFNKENLADELNAIIKQGKAAVAEEKARIEEEKKKNLSKKKALLAELETIIENDETLDTIKRVKEIQGEWKNIRVISKDQQSKLWERYRFLLDKFYDNHTINIDLKNLDRQKNLEAKIELTKKVDALVNETSMRKCFIKLNKYHEEFKNIGPVPQESREPIWLAFKKASDNIYEIKRAEYEKIEELQTENLEKKKLLVEKASVLTQVVPSDIKGWNTTTKELEAVFDEWKKIGRVPKSNNDQVWKDFNGIRNTFYTARKEFFAEINKHRKANLILKEDLCKRVEALKDDTNWGDTTKEIIGIQAEWKKIGPVPDRDNQAIWKRFRKACDAFFSNKDNAFKGQREEEAANLKKKDELLVKLATLVDSKGDEQKIFDDLKKIGAEWKSIGFVPRKDVKRVNETYRKANDAIYKRFNKAKESMREEQMLEHYQKLSTAPNAEEMLRRERSGIKRKIAYLNDEILSIERNLSFFAKSSTADKMLQEFESKIEINRKKIEKLKKELTAIKKAGQKPKIEEPSEEASSEPDTKGEAT